VITSSELADVVDVVAGLRGHLDGTDVGARVDEGQPHHETGMIRGHEPVAAADESVRETMRLLQMIGMHARRG
jgi:hypothetical protein